VAGYDVELRGEDGKPVPDGEIGDLYIRGPSAALMYWGNRAKSAETFQGGWTKSGDKYHRDADGNYVYAGRSDDMIKVSGQFVSPFEVEATLMKHAAVLEAAFIGTPDADGITRSKAFWCQPGQSGPRLSRRSSGVREGPARATRSACASSSPMPKTATGKIQRFGWKERGRRAPPRAA
jgi:benzoate-CoA ligase